MGDKRSILPPRADYMQTLYEQDRHDLPGAIVKGEKLWAEHPEDVHLFLFLKGAYDKNEEYAKIEALCKQAFSCVTEAYLWVVHNEYAATARKIDLGEEEVARRLYAALDAGYHQERIHLHLAASLRRLHREGEYCRILYESIQKNPDHYDDSKAQLVKFLERMANQDVPGGDLEQNLHRYIEYASYNKIVQQENINNHLI